MQSDNIKEVKKEVREGSGGAVFILASSSRSRLQLLEKIGYKPMATISPEINETQFRGEKPRNLCTRLAKQKCFAAFELLKTQHSVLELLQKHKSIVLLSADTVCASGAKVLDKALNDNDVKACLEALSGKNHSVFTSMCVLQIRAEGFDGSFLQNQDALNPNIKKYKFYNLSKNLPSFLKFSQITTQTRIKFKKLSPAEIEHFAASKQGIGNAGGYTIGGLAESFCININGSFSSVIGLSTYNASKLLTSSGVRQWL